MRKRVLIKNFVADLLKAQNERRRLGSISPISSDEEEWDEYEEDEEEEEQHHQHQHTQVDHHLEVDEDEDDEPVPTPLPPLAPPQARSFVDSDPSLSSLFPDYLETAPDSISVGCEQTKLSSEDRLWVYDAYGSESEQAYAPADAVWHHHHPQAVEGWTISYDGEECTPYDQPLYVDPGQLCFSDELYPQRPIEGHDHFFLSLSGGHLAEMKSYAVELPEDVTADGREVAPNKRSASGEAHEAPAKRAKLI